MSHNNQAASSVTETDHPFRELMMQAPVGIAILRGGDFIVEMANHTYLEVVAQREEAFVGKPLFEVLPLVEEAVRPLLEGVMKTGKSYHGRDFKVYIERHGKTDTTYFNFVYQPLRDADGSVCGVIVVATEVTSYLEARHALEQKENAFRRMVMQSPIAMTIFKGKDYVIELANEAMFKKIWRKEEKDVIGQKALDVFPELNDQKYPELLRHVVETRQPHWEYESLAYVQGDDGMKRFYLDFEYSPLFETDGSVYGIMITVNDVTERVEARQRLEDAEARLRLAAEGTGLATWDLDLVSYDIIYSPRMAEIFGYDGDKKMSHADMRAHLHPDDRDDIVLKAFATAMETGVYAYTARIRWQDGSTHWVHTLGRVIFDEQRRPQRMLGTMTDITEQKMALQALEENEQRLNIVLEASEMGAWELNLETRQPAYSKRYLQILGFEENEKPSHEDLLQRIHPADLEKRNQSIANAFENGKLDLEIRIQTRGGALRWVRARGNVFYNQKNTPVKLLGTLADITDQKSAFEALQASEAKLNKLADAMPQLVWIATPEEGIIYYNNRILEYVPTREEMLGTASWDRLIHPDDMESTGNAWTAAMENKSDYAHAHRIRMRNGRYRWHLSRAYPEKNGSGNVIKWYGTATDIDDIKRIESSLQESEERLRLALEAASMGTWSIDLASGRAITSDKHREIMGYEASDRLTREMYLQYLHPDDRFMVDEEYRKGLRDGSYQFEARVLRPGKPMSWIKVYGRRIAGEDDQPRIMLGTIVDITEEKNAADRVSDAFRALQESEERFKMVADRAPVMIWMSGNDKFLDFFNSSWLNFTGRTLEQERGEGWQQGVHPADLQKCIGTYNHAFANQKPFHLEYRLRRYDGAYRWISDNAEPRYTSDGRFVGYISACMDIDEEKNFNQRLQESELLFKTIATVSPVGLWMTDATGRNSFVNETWIQWTGVPLEEQTGDGWLRNLPEDDRAEVYGRYVKAANARAKFTAEFKFVNAAGALRWVQSEGFPYYDAEGKFAGYAGSVSDITERKQEEIRKNDFLAVASHELKTPITSIKAYTQLLAATYEKANDAFLKNALSKMENQVNRMSKLVGDFLNLSKIESDRFELKQERFLLNDMIEEVVGEIQWLVPGHRIEIKLGAEAMVYGDREKIMQVLTNFLNNAVKYAPGEKEIMVTLERQDEKAMVCVKDRGVGIRNDEQEKIFQRFYRADSNSVHTSGFGIGLYISAEIIRRHGGEIGVGDNDGRGSIFYFKLPLAE